MASQNQLVPAINQNQLHNQHNQLALQQNRSTSDLIQMSNLSTQIQMNGIQHTYVLREFASKNNIKVVMNELGRIDQFIQAYLGPILAFLRL